MLGLALLLLLLALVAAVGVVLVCQRCCIRVLVRVWVLLPLPALVLPL